MPLIPIIAAMLVLAVGMSILADARPAHAPVTVPRIGAGR